MSEDEDDTFETHLFQIEKMNASLKNCGSTCYINAAQLLFQIPFIEEFFESPKEECSELGQSLKMLYYEVKFSETVCDPIDFICNYNCFYDQDDTDGGDAAECLIHLFKIIDSDFNVDNSLFLYQMKKRVTCEKQHSFVYDHQCELFLELYFYDNNFESINDWVNNCFLNEKTEEALCQTENEIVQCKCCYFIDPIPMILFIHINRYYYSKESQNAERIPSNIQINEEIAVAQNTFRFKGAILHFDSRNSGHYQTLIRNEDGYYLYNDSSIEEIKHMDFEDFDENYDVLLYQKI